jgi:hypothetical protein
VECSADVAQLEKNLADINAQLYEEHGGTASAAPVKVVVGDAKTEIEMSELEFGDSNSIDFGEGFKEQPSRLGRKPSFYRRMVRRTKSSTNVKRGKQSLDGAKATKENGKTTPDFKVPRSLQKAQSSFAVLSSNSNGRRGSLRSGSRKRRESGAKTRSDSIKSFASHVEE